MAAEVRRGRGEWIRSIGAMRDWSRRARRGGRSLSFVPTMGALHAGHLALVAAARASCDRVVVSIFVNPTQFGPDEDYRGYPRRTRRDRELLARAGVDAVFAPRAPSMYPRPPLTRVSVPELAGRLCGADRPGHFDGVCLVVAKLLHTVQPSELFLGQKDAQQAAVVSRMVRDLNFDVRVRVRPTVRERDGLAMSSRNAYLTEDERAYAPRLYEALRAGKRTVSAGERSARAVVRHVRKRLESPVARIEYVEVSDARTLAAVTEIDRAVLIALAVRVGRARLIDNITARPPRGAR